MGRLLRVKAENGSHNKQYFRITSKMIKALLEGWERGWRKIKERCEPQREVACLAAAVVIRFCGGLRVEEVFFASQEGMLNVW